MPATNLLEKEGSSKENEEVTTHYRGLAPVLPIREARGTASPSSLASRGKPLIWLRCALSSVNSDLAGASPPSRRR